MDSAAQQVATGAGGFFVKEWIPIVLDPYTWIALLSAWAMVETVKQLQFVYKLPPGTRRDVSRILAFVITSLFGFVAYEHYVGLEHPYIPAVVLGVLSPWIYRIVSAIMDKYEFTRSILDAVKPHRRNKFVPLPKENDDDPTLFKREDD